MSITTPTAPPPATSISLAEVATRYLDALQHAYDVTAFSLAGARKINEEDYDEYSQALQVMPRHEARMPFERAKEATQLWFLRNSLSDCIALVGPLLEDCRTISELCLYKVAGKNDPVVLQNIVNEDRSKFLRLPLPERFKILEEKYNITTPVQEHIIGLVEAAKCLIFKQGIVSAEEAIMDGKLKVKIRSVQITQVPETQPSNEPTLSLTRRVADAEKTFKIGDKVIFTKAEHIGSIITVGIFTTTVLQCLQTFAQKTGAADD